MTSAALETGRPVDIELPTVAGELAPQVDVRFDGPTGQRLVLPAFATGDGSSRVRFSAPTAGTWAYTLQTEAAVTPVDGRLDVAPYVGDNPLYLHGRLRVAEGGRTLAHDDGTPFLWVGDTWWMGLASRLDWPDGFETLLRDRVEKGFSVVQLVAGPLPDFAATPDGIWHEQQANEAGWPWERGWARIDPAYYDMADRRISALVEAGIVPCIVGMWGFYGTVIGRERALAHWRNLIGRYAAYPVVFVAAGEFDYPGYDSEASDEERAQRRRSQVAIWSEVVSSIARTDPYRNPVTLHPGNTHSRSRAAADTPMTIDMIQTSHWSYHEPKSEFREQIGKDLGLPTLMRSGFTGALEVTVEALAAEPPMPVINGEGAYEGILGGNWQDVQRFDYWTGMLSGLAGFTYGADGIWQMASSSEAFANSVSKWGSTTWQEAMHHAGSRQVGLGGRILRGLEWWTLRPVPQERAQAAGRLHAFGAANGHQAIYYLPSILLDEPLQGMRDLPLDAPGDGAVAARYVDPRSGEEYPAVDVARSVDGTWLPPEAPTYADWLLLLEADGKVDG